MGRTVTLAVDGHHGTAAVDVDVECGGRLAQITVRGRPLLIDPPSVADNPAADRDATSTGWGSYPMAPWAGRVRHGEFRFLGVHHHLDLNHQDGTDGDGNRRHAIHGTVFSQPWTVESHHDTSITMSCPLGPSAPPTAPAASASRRDGWTFGGIARQTVEVLDGQLRCDLSIEVDHRHIDHRVDLHSIGPDHHPDHDTDRGPGDQHTPVAFPGEIGWHPWFRKPTSLTFHPDAMYECDGIGLPTGRLVVPTPGPWDDCFVNTAPVTLHYADSPLGDVTLSSDCDHWVVYDMPADATCVEPQSGPPDAFNIRPRLVTTTHPLRRTMNIAW
jgi:aldose 1-epimerase